MNEHDEFLNKIARRLSGNDADEFSAAPAEKNNEWQAYQRVWEITGELNSPPPSKNIWSKIAEEIDTEGSPRRLPLDLPKRTPVTIAWTSFRWPLRIAAGIVVCLCAGWFLKAQFLSTEMVVTKNGERTTISLPDGSSAELNAASRINYIKNFADNREVEVAGEVFFSVRPGNSPFIVKTENSRVEVLGTQFNVQSRGHLTVVIVEKGRVSLANRDNREVVLQKGQMSRVEINEPPTKPESVNLDHFLAWRSGRIEFQRTPLRAVVDELQRQFDLSIQLANPDSAELTLTASFQISQPLPEVLSAIGLTFGWDFHKSNGVFIIENK